MLPLIIKGLARLFSVVPRCVADAWGRGLGFLLYGAVGSKRRLCRENVSTSLPDWSDAQIRRTVRGVFRTQGLFIAELLRMLGGAKPSPLDMVDISPEDQARVDEAYGRGKGVLVLTAHINNYELLLQWSGQRYPMTVVTKRLRPESLNQFFIESRSSKGIQVLPARGSFRDIIRALRKGGCIGFVFDQNMKHDEGVFVTFFGRPACTTPGLAILSAHAQSPVLPVCLIRKGDRYQFRSLPVIEAPTDRDPVTIQNLTQQYSNAIEQMIREQPESWIWMHKRWKTPPKPGDRITLPDGTDYHA